MEHPLSRNPAGTGSVVRRSLVLAAVVTGLLCLMAGSASARKSQAVKPLVRGSTYLALGDSVTFGYQEPTVVPAPNYNDASSFVAYPALVGRALKVKVVNAACPGETSSSLINTSAQSNGCENSLGSSTGYRTSFPLHVRYSGSQLAFAVKYLRTHRKVRLVSLMVGANDVFLCQKTTPDGCLSSSEQQAVLAKVKANVKQIVSTIRKRGRYRGQLVIVNYYSLNYASSLLSAVSQAINTAQDSAAKPFGAKFADGYGLVGAATRLFGGDTCKAGLLTRLSSGGCGVHPTLAAHSLFAQAVLQVTKK